MLRHNKQQVSVLMSRFIWSYSVGDNIAYNFKILFTLYADKDNSNNKGIYNKPLIVLVVSIIECIMFDFVVRLEQATNQYPTTISADKRAKIKAKLSSEKVTRKIKFLDQVKTVQRLKNYSLEQIITIFKG